MNTIARNMHFSAAAVLAFLVLVALALGPLVKPVVTHQLEAGCAAGEIDAGLCWVAEVGGLVTPTP
ncbi:MAG: hypothetical protein JXD18_14950 [Anaerolineae bacterium]|nr:hypothetical protein [Anaerolineae bacterium]